MANAKKPAPRVMKFQGDVSRLRYQLGGNPLFNTFRKGDKWADLQPGDLVECVEADDPPSGEEPVHFGTYEVLATYLLPLSNALDAHAALNSEVCHLTNVSARRSGLREVLGRVYSITTDHKFTVVYLRRKKK